MNDSLKKAFEQAATENYWSDKDSLSGPGSNLIQTRIIRQEIPKLLKKYGVKKMLDAPCGDLFWMSLIKDELSGVLKTYIGGDIVPKIIKQNNQLYSSDIFSFIEIDITSDTLPNVDLVFTRDCFLHLSYLNIYRALKNYKNSKTKYLLVSTYTKKRKNIDVISVSLEGRAINLQAFPFFFSMPDALINEGCTESNNEYTDKSLALWELKNINLSFISSYLFFTRGTNFIQHKIKRWLR